MATFQLHLDQSRVVVHDDVRFIMFSASLFEKDETHDTRDPEKCAGNPHTTREFMVLEDTKKEEVHAVLQTAANEWAESCVAARADRAAIEAFA